MSELGGGGGGGGGGERGGGGARRGEGGEGREGGEGGEPLLKRQRAANQNDGKEKDEDKVRTSRERETSPSLPSPSLLASFFFSLPSPLLFSLGSARVRCIIHVCNACIHVLNLVARMYACCTSTSMLDEQLVVSSKLHVVLSHFKIKFTPMVTRCKFSSRW